MQGPLSVALEEPDQDQVQDDIERAAQSVLGFPGGARAMINDELRDPRALPGGEDRDESMHLAIEPDPFEHAAAIRLERAAKIVQRDTGEPRNQAVGNPRWDLPRDQGIVAILPPARHNVVARIELLQEPGDIGRVILAIAIDGHEDLTARLVKRGRQRRGLAAVAPKEHDPDVLRIAPLDRLQPRGRAVGRAIIDEDQLIPHRQAAQHRVELGVQRLDVVDLVENRNQYRQIERV